jgi:hypothetical protein
MEKGGTTMAFKYLYTSASAFPIRPVSKPLWAGASIIPAKRGCCLHGRREKCHVSSRVESSRRTDSDWKRRKQICGSCSKSCSCGGAAVSHKSCSNWTCSCRKQIWGLKWQKVVVATLSTVSNFKVVVYVVLCNAPSHHGTAEIMWGEPMFQGFYNHSLLLQLLYRLLIVW